MRRSMHEKCGAVLRDGDGEIRAVCRRSEGHHASNRPERAAHYDPSRELLWDAQGRTWNMGEPMPS